MIAEYDHKLSSVLPVPQQAGEGHSVVRRTPTSPLERARKAALAGSQLERSRKAAADEQAAPHLARCNSDDMSHEKH